MLTAIAEKAGTQGYDLYSLTLGKNRNFHHAVEFWLGAIEDNDKNLPYAKMMHGAGKEQD